MRLAPLMSLPSPQTIWQMHPPALSALMDDLAALDQRELVRLTVDAKAGAVTAPKPPYSLYGGVAVLDIAGTISKYPTIWGRLFGGTSTLETIDALAAALADDRVSSIVMRYDSGGGEAVGVSDLADAVYAARSRKPIVSYIEDRGASAAYHAASQASRVYANPGAMVGSIGTYLVAKDSSVQAAARGIKIVVIKEGAYKGIGIDGTPLTDEQIAELSRIVQSINSQFVQNVARGRPSLSPSYIRGLQGAVLIGKAAVTGGLVDEIASFDSVLARLQTATRPPGNRSLPTGQAAVREFVKLAKSSAPLTHYGDARYGYNAAKEANPGLHAAFVAAGGEQMSHLWL